MRSLSWNLQTAPGIQVSPQNMTDMSVVKSQPSIPAELAACPPCNLLPTGPPNSRGLSPPPDFRVLSIPSSSLPSIFNQWSSLLILLLKPFVVYLFPSIFHCYHLVQALVISLQVYVTTYDVPVWQTGFMPIV